MKNLLFTLIAVQTGTYKGVPVVGAGAGSGSGTYWKSEPELEPKRIISAPQHWLYVPILSMG